MHFFDYNTDHLGLGTIDAPEWRIDDRPRAYATRAAAARAGLWGNHGYEADYELVYVDADGAALNGAHRYELRLDAMPPVDAFWSLTMYNVPEFLLVDNPIDRYSIGDRTPGLQVAGDGSLTIYLQHESPGPDKEANWLPAPAGDFRPIMRMYQPKPEVLDGSFALPAITKVELTVPPCVTCTARLLPDDDGDRLADHRAATWRRLLRPAVVLAALAVVFGWLLPRFIDYQEVWDALTELDALGDSSIARARAGSRSHRGVDVSGVLAGAVVVARDRGLSLFESGGTGAAASRPERRPVRLLPWWRLRAGRGRARRAGLVPVPDDRTPAASLGRARGAACHRRGQRLTSVGGRNLARRHRGRWRRRLRLPPWRALCPLARREAGATASPGSS